MCMECMCGKTAIESGEGEDFIVGGERANLDMYPWVAKIVTTGSHQDSGEDGNKVCSGAIISDMHILTAASCMFNESYSKGSIFLLSSPPPPSANGKVPISKFSIFLI